jgi:acyl-CoA synthetase (AMP-forming)/AMP-acid ligase II
MPAAETSSTIGAFMRAAGERYADDEAVVGGGKRLTYRQVDRRSRDLARLLAGRSITKGTHVGVALSNGPDFLVAFAAICRIGAVAVPMSTIARGRELLRLIRHGDLAAIVTSRLVAGVDQVARLEDAVPGLEDCTRTGFTLPSVPYLRQIAFMDLDGGPLRRWATEAWSDDQDALHADEVLLEAMEHDVHVNDIALMIHTSGTTSDPKGVPHTHDTVTFRARDLAYRFQFRHGDRTLVSYQLFWVGGLVMNLLPSLAAGATSIWVDRFEAGEVLREIERERATRLLAYPADIAALVAHPDFATCDRSSLTVADPRARVSPGTSLETPTGEIMGLGMTETFGPYWWGFPPGPTPALNSLQECLELKVVDEAGEPVTDGGSGEIRVRGRCVTPGYHKRARHTGFDADGWLRTGDRGVLEDGVIHFGGRMDDMIKTRGANVAPAEVVAALCALDGVEEAHVVAIPSATRGQTVAAAVVLAATCERDAETLQAELRRDLSPFKIPSVIAIVSGDDIPRTPTQKIRPAELAELICSRTLAASQPAVAAGPHVPDEANAEIGVT